MPARDAVSGARLRGVMCTRTEKSRKLKNVLIMVMLVSAPVFGVQENINLTTSEAISAARSINEAFDGISDNVTKCVEENNGKTDGCLCVTRAECPFKSEFDNFVETFCSVIEQYPEWKSRNVWYSTEDGMGHTLGTKNIQIHYGESC